MADTQVQDTRSQFDIAGQNRANFIGQLLGLAGQALAPQGSWQSGLGQVGAGANQQLLQQQAAQKQTSQINTAGAQQQNQLAAMLQLLLGGAGGGGLPMPGVAPVAAPMATGPIPATAPMTPGVMPVAAGGATESPFVQALLQALPQYR